MPNRLAQESSPYLRQHSGNPVDWYPWGEEALARARSEDRPILLSIGYSSCHWCHVMERESFENTETATIMNETFVNVKVDREERPDLDSVYMRAVQSITGHGGWPLTAFLTPEGVPYYGGTYFPPEPRHGVPSFRQVLRAASDAYRKRREDVRAAAERMRHLLDRSMLEDREVPEADEATMPDVLDGAFRLAVSQFDTVHGGFGSAPKFPQPMTLEFLLRYHHRTGNREALRMVSHTLQHMARGGIRDHLAGGFHRYSVDAGWLVPHFEKMLYDNALLARLYVCAFQVTGDSELKGTAEDTLDYLLTDFRAPGGAFFTARDADSEGEEGRYYVWEAGEIDALLATDEAHLFKRCYGVGPSGNFGGRSILHLAGDPCKVAASEGMGANELLAVLHRARQKLLEARMHRPPPFRDEKILASWNGLALRAFAEAGGALGRSDYTRVAREGAGFLLGELRKDGVLHRTLTDGRARVKGFLEDYAAVGGALLTLHEVTLEAEWLQEADWMATRMLDRFWDEDSGAFYDTSGESEPLVVRPRDVMDTAAPSGNSLAIELLARLGSLLDSHRYRNVTTRALARELPSLRRFPLAFGRLLSVMETQVRGPVQIAIVGDLADAPTQDLLRAALAPYLPHRVIAGREPGAPPPLPTPLLDGRDPPGGRPAAWVCRHYACQAPTTDPWQLAASLS